jgi:hypothetical protein
MQLGYLLDKSVTGGKRTPSRPTPLDMFSTEDHGSPPNEVNLDVDSLYASIETLVKGLRGEADLLGNASQLGQGSTLPV